MSDVQRPLLETAPTSTWVKPQPWDLGKRYMRGELEAADFIDQSSRVMPVRLVFARAIEVFLGSFVVTSYTVLAIYLLSIDRLAPAGLSLAGALGVGLFTAIRWRRRH